MNNKHLVWAIWFYIPLFILLKWVCMYVKFQNGLVISVFLLLIGSLCLARDNFKPLISNWTEKFILLYIIYNLFSSLITLDRGYSVSIVTSEIANSLIPIFLFYIGDSLDEKEADVFENIVMISGIAITVIGIYYNIGLEDPYYIEFLNETQPNFSLHGFTVFPRLCAMLGSVECGTLGYVCLGFSLRKLVKERFLQFFFFFITGVLLPLLTLQRSAMCCVVFEVIVCFMYIKNKQSTIIFLIMFLLILFFSFIIVRSYFNDTFQTISYRFSIVDSAVSERSGGWMNALNNGFFALLFGYGFATGGQRAIGISASTVNDGNFFKVIYDCGLVGLILLLFIFLSLMRKKTKTHYYSIILYCFLFQMVGSNILTFQFTASLVWYVLGRLNRTNGQSEQEPTTMLSATNA